MNESFISKHICPICWDYPEITYQDGAYPHEDRATVISCACEDSPLVIPHPGRLYASRFDGLHAFSVWKERCVTHEDYIDLDAWRKVYAPK